MMAKQDAPRILLKLHGKPFNPNSVCDQSHKVKTFLDNSPEDLLYDSAEIMSTTNTTQGTLSGITQALREEGYALRTGRINLYGNKVAIAELKRTTGA